MTRYSNPFMTIAACVSALELPLHLILPFDLKLLLLIIINIFTLDCSKCITCHFVVFSSAIDCHKIGCLCTRSHAAVRKRLLLSRSVHGLVVHIVDTWHRCSYSIWLIVPNFLHVSVKRSVFIRQIYLHVMAHYFHVAACDGWLAATGQRGRCGRLGWIDDHFRLMHCSWNRCEHQRLKVGIVLRAHLIFVSLDRVRLVAKVVDRVLLHFVEVAPNLF